MGNLAEAIGWVLLIILGMAIIGIAILFVVSIWITWQKSRNGEDWDASWHPEIPKDIKSTRITRKSKK